MLKIPIFRILLPITFPTTKPLLLNFIIAIKDVNISGAEVLSARKTVPI